MSGSNLPWLCKNVFIKEADKLATIAAEPFGDLKLSAMIY